MQDYSKLVEALRKVADYINCYDCDMWGLGECDTERKSCVLHNAAAAIEALQATIELMKPYIPDFFPDANKVMLPKMEVQDGENES